MAAPGLSDLTSRTMRAFLPLAAVAPHGVLHDWALVDVHVSVVLPLGGTTAGSAIRLTVGAGGGPATATVTELDAAPAGP